MLSNVCSLDNEADYIRLQQTLRHELIDVVERCGYSSRRADLVQCRQKQGSWWCVYNNMEEICSLFVVASKVASSAHVFAM